MALAGISHVTLTVSDLDRSLAFYTGPLGATLRARWPRGAYLDAGGLWLCLELSDRVTPRSDDTHMAFAVAGPDFAALAARIDAVAPRWKENRSEGASVYFLDPDGHRLEIHAGGLDSRLSAMAGRADVVLPPDDPA